MILFETNSKFKRKLKKLKNNKNIISKILLFCENPSNQKFKKHKLNWFKEDIYSIKLWYDLSALYFTKKEDKHGNISYVFFDIWTHNEVY